MKPLSQREQAARAVAPEIAGSTLGPPVERTADILRQVRDAAKARGIRWTNQRQSIVETFIACGDHVTAEELHRRARAADPTVSAATVYRTVNLLVELGYAHKGHFGSGSASFEWAGDREHHDHLICVSCGKIEEFHNAQIERLQEKVAKERGFRLQRHRMELYGLCAGCAGHR